MVKKFVKFKGERSKTLNPLWIKKNYPKTFNWIASWSECDSKVELDNLFNKINEKE